MNRVIEMKTVTGIGIDFIEPEPDYAQNLFIRTRQKYLTGHSLVLKKIGLTNSKKKGMPSYRI